MRFSSEDEHVSLYGKPVNGLTTSSQLLLKTFSGIYGYVDENGQELVLRNPQGGADMPYPCLSVQKLINAFTDPQWQIESLRISHVQLVGNRLDFLKLASCIAQCHTLKTVILGDARTSLLRDQESTSGFDAMIGAFSQSANLTEISLQNMQEVSQVALGDLCRSTSIEKLQLLLSQSLLPTGGISGDYIYNMAQQLKSNHTMKELRIFGVLDEEACHLISEMLLVNTTLQKIALKIKLKKPQPANNTNSLSLFRTLESASCSLVSMELYLSGSRQDLEACATPFRDALRANQSLKQLNVIFYGLDNLHGGGRGGGGPLAATRTNELWMERLQEALVANYSLQQVMINHGLLELSDKAKFYVRLNRAGRGDLLANRQDGRSRPDVNHWVDTMARVKNDISCLFYLVSCAPALLCGQRLNDPPCLALPLQELESLPLKRRRKR